MEKPVKDTEVVSENNNHNEIKKKKKNRRGRLSVLQKVLIGIFLFLYAVVIAVTALYVKVTGFVPDVGQGEVKKETEIVTDTDGEIIEVIEHQYTRVQDKYNILVLGHDRAAMLTDVFMLVNIDCNTHAITVMQIPRDTWISDNDEVYIMTNKINAVFATYFNLHRGKGIETGEAYDMALESVTKVIEESLFIDIDYSAIMDLDGFVNIVNILGGVEIDVPIDMNYYDPEQGLYINIPAGHQVLDGNMAEGFVRFRSGYATADLGRQNAQKQFMTALFNKIKGSLSLTNVPQLTELADEIFTNIDTDMTAMEVLFFAKEILKCDLSTINMMTMPGNLASSYYVMNRAAMLDVINTSYNVHDKAITDGLFDKNFAFNNAYNYSMNDAYYASKDRLWDSSVYNGEDMNEENIIPRN